MINFWVYSELKEDFCRVWYMFVSLFCVCDSYAQHLFYVEIAPLCQIWSYYYKRISLLLRHQTIEECVYRLSYNFHHNFELKIESKEARIKRTPRDLTRVSYGEISVHSYFLLCSSTFCTYHVKYISIIEADRKIR